MIAGGKGGGSAAQTPTSAGGGNMLTALLGSPIAQHLSGNRPPAPEMAGKSVNEPGMFGLSHAQKNYWAERARQQGGLEQRQQFDAMELANATEARHAPTQPFPAARTSQPSLDDLLKAVMQSNRYRKPIR